jgi:hypothetical protein
MYSDATLTTHLQTSSVIQTKSKVIAEWNLNLFENMEAIGNYFYRPDTGSSRYISGYENLPTSFVAETSSTVNPRYFGGTDYDYILDGGYLEDGVTPSTFLKQDDRQKALMSLEDCFKRFRPRSGINKLRYFANKQLPPSNDTMYLRPRYYVAGKDDNFKYWSSYRKLGTLATGAVNAVGVSYTSGSDFFIEDVAPFVKYKNTVPSNRVVIKLQTNIGDSQLPNVSSDPFFSGSATNYKSTPLIWKVEKLNSTNQWVEIYSTSSDVFTSDGYVELTYGITNIPGTYVNNFKLIGTISSSYTLPNLSADAAGTAYLVTTSSTDKGTLSIWTGSAWSSVTPTYGWYLNTQTVTNSQQYVNDLNLATAPSYVSGPDRIYREFDSINGLRVSAVEMKNNNTTFDLIEISPRLVADLTDYTLSYSIKKSASDIGVTGIPVGQLLASTGQINLFDYNQVFNENNINSILNVYLSGEFKFTFASKNLQLKFYEAVSKVLQGDSTYKDYIIPIKTMYVDGFPQYNNANREVAFNLRDLFFYFESITAPQIMMQNATMSSIIATLLDGIGFSNYIFKRGKTRDGKVESDPVIPYFFVGPERTIIQVLNDLAQSTQTAMFFDESNNFICMTKGFLVPEDTTVRNTDITLYGNDTSGGIKANIIDIKTENNDVYNDGKIVYRNRYIQKEVSSLTETSKLDKDRRWRYKPVLLWEVAGEESTKSKNEQLSTQSNYVLGAIPLAATLTDSLPTVAVVNGTNTIVNNIIEFGDGVYWMSRYSGYFYANGEIVKYDAIEYSVGGIASPVWVTSVEEYQRYFAGITFGGQMYPTGRVRIYAEPYWNSDGTLKLGPVAKHGREQFGTSRATHYAGISNNQTWLTNYVKQYATDYQYLFYKTQNSEKTQKIKDDKADIVSKFATTTTQIKNYLGEAKYNVKTGKYDLFNDTIQSSALVFTGPSFSSDNSSAAAVNVIKKDLTTSGNKYDTFGTRLRVIGTTVSGTSSQNPNGNFDMYSVQDSSKKETVLGGSSGGICIYTNADGEGYYLEVAALTNSSPTSLTSADDLHNIFFYKMEKDGTILKPVKLWSGFKSVITDDGLFVGQGRTSTEQNPTVYDLSIQAKQSLNSDKSRTFSIYFNNSLIEVVNDTSPLPLVQNVGLFIRGSSKLMFENVFAINTVKGNDDVVSNINSIFSSASSNLNMNKYALSGVVQSTFINNLSSNTKTQSTIFYEEFGTIMREMSYFNIKFDKAYPALYSTIAPTFSKNKGYIVSGYTPNAYGAEFLVFNATDTALALDATSGNYLRILGVSFTQESAHDLTVDEYYSKRSDLSNQDGINLSINPSTYKQEYIDIKNSRLTYGTKSFTIDSPYIQNYDTAYKLMDWTINKLKKPRKSVGVNVFGLPILQLGDIVQVSYRSSSVDQVSLETSKFVVYSIEHSKDGTGLSALVYLSEVV